MEISRQWKENNSQPISMKMSFKNEGEIETFSNKQKLRSN